jgi:hypothetical protein
MHPDLDSALERDFPCLYRDRRGDTRETRMCDGFPGDGWEPLIRRMSEELEPFCVGTDLRAEQVKEKGGELRVYLHSSGPIPDEVLAAVDDAEGESRRTCEGCGAAGAPREVGWIKTLCADCATFAEEFSRRRSERTPADEEWLAQFRGEFGRLLYFEDALRRWRSCAGTSDPALAEFHRRRLSRDTISGAELSARLGIDPLEEAKWRRVAEERVARSRRRVWLDDVRDTPAGWTRAYTAGEALALLAAGGVCEISLDHDLGDEATCGTGHDVVCWIEEQVALYGFEPPAMHIHSANSVGRQRMQRAIESIERLHRQRSEGGSERRTFVDLALAGLIADPEEAVNDYIAEWHESDTRLPLHEWLGLTQEQHALFVEKPECLRTLLARIEARRGGGDEP